MTKAEKILTTLARFGVLTIDIANPEVRRFLDALLGVRGFVEDKRTENPKLSMSQMASGLEQCLRETPMIIQSMQPEFRNTLAKAFNAALTESYPEFLVKEREKLEKVINRGKIRSEAEYYRIRYEIDLAEADKQRTKELAVLYRLVDEYESRN